MPALPERFGEYLLVQRLSESMSDVFVAVKLGDREGRTVVLKRPKLGARASGEAAQAILREVEVLRDVQAPHVIRLEQTGDLAGLPFAVFEHIRGISLDVLLARVHSLGEAATWTIARDILLGLSALHDAGWVHCDIAPSNVVIDDEGEAHLIDLGIAHRNGGGRDAIMGKPGYVAPEVAALRPASPAEDIYSWATLVFECRTGGRLFPEIDLAEAAVRKDRSQDIVDFDPQGLLGRALVRAPAERPTARALASQIEAQTLGRMELGEFVGRAIGSAGTIERDTEIQAIHSLNAIESAALDASAISSSRVAPAITSSAPAGPTSRPTDSTPPAPEQPSTFRGVWLLIGVASLVLLGAAGVGGYFLGHTNDHPPRSREPLLTLPALPVRTEIHLDGHALLVTEPGRPIPISQGMHTISMSGPKHDGKEYEFVVRDGDNVVIVPMGVLTAIPKDSAEPRREPRR